MNRLHIAILTNIYFNAAAPENARERHALLMAQFAEAVECTGVDLVVDLGDRIHAETAEQDRQSTIAVMEGFNALACPVHVLAGNHDIRNLSADAYTEITGHPVESRSINEKGHHLVFWNPSYRGDAEDSLTLQKDDLDWLENDLTETDMPAVVFTHIPLDRENGKQDDPGRYWTNARTARTIIRQSGKVLLCLSGHDRAPRTRVVDDVCCSTRKPFHNTVLDRKKGIRQAYSTLSLDNGQALLM